MPEGEDVQEWIAVHGACSYLSPTLVNIARGAQKLTPLVVDFFNHVNMLYGTISEFCTPTEVS